MLAECCYLSGDVKRALDVLDAAAGARRAQPRSRHARGAARHVLHPRQRHALGDRAAPGAPPRCSAARSPTIPPRSAGAIGAAIGAIVAADRRSRDRGADRAAGDDRPRRARADAAVQQQHAGGVPDRASARRVPDRPDGAAVARARQLPGVGATATARSRGSCTAAELAPPGVPVRQARRRAQPPARRSRAAPVGRVRVRAVRVAVAQPARRGDRLPARRRARAAARSAITSTPATPRPSRSRSGCSAAPSRSAEICHDARIYRQQCREVDDIAWRAPARPGRSIACAC